MEAGLGMRLGVRFTYFRGEGTKKNDLVHPLYILLMNDQNCLNQFRAVLLIPWTCPSRPGRNEETTCREQFTAG